MYNPGNVFAFDFIIKEAADVNNMINNNNAREIVENGA